MSPTGHLAVGLAAKRFAAQVPVIVLMAAAYAIDLLYFVFLALGLDRFEYDPWSHSLVMAIVWAAAAGLITRLLIKNARSGLVVGLVVFSHWVLDFIVWDNLSVYFDQSQRIGLGLYNRIGFSLTGAAFSSGTAIATAIEAGMLLIGLGTYLLHRKKARTVKTIS